jgi:hypothetical protein
MEANRKASRDALKNLELRTTAIVLERTLCCAMRSNENVLASKAASRGARSLADSATNTEISWQQNHAAILWPAELNGRQKWPGKQTYGFQKISWTPIWALHQNSLGSSWTLACMMSPALLALLSIWANLCR